MTTSTSHLKATPAKLRSGNWGARVQSITADEGAIVSIETKAGKVWLAQITRVVWRGDGVTLCETRGIKTEANATSPTPRTKRGSSARRPRSGGRCRGAGCGQAAVRDGMCRQCHFDEFDC